MRRSLDVCLRRAVPVAASTLLAACAVQTTGPGQVHFGFDNAQLFGQEVGTFSLPGNTDGSLRVLNGQYSVKLSKYAKVIPIENATNVRVVRVDAVADRALLVLEKSQRNCNYKTQLLSIKGTDVLTWDLGDCNTHPTITAAPTSVAFDFAQPKTTTRFTYQDARLFRSDFPSGSPPLPTAVAASPQARPATAATTLAASSPRYVPGPPISVASSSKPASPETTAVSQGQTATSPATTRNQPRSPEAPRDLVFPSQEQKPVRIVLSN